MNFKIRNKLEVLIVIIISVFFSSFTLFLLETPIKYILFVFEIIFIIYIYLIINQYKIKFRWKLNSNLALPKQIWTFFLIFPILLLITQFINLQDNFLIGFISLITISFLPGYSILKTNELSKNFSKLEFILFSHIISYIFTSFFWFILLFFKIKYAEVIYLISVIVISLFSINSSKNFESPIKKDSQFNFSNNKIQYLGLVLMILFLIVSFIFIYPDFALNTGNDLADHYSNSLILIRSPEYLINSNYLLANLFQAALIELSSCSYLNIQLNLLLLNCWLPVAFYCAVKRFFPKNKFVPIIAVIFWILLTNSYGGFSFLYFLRAKIFSTTDQYALLLDTNTHTYYSIWYGLIGLWYVPWIISIIMLLALISLIKNQSISRNKYYILFILIFITIYLTHVTEAILISFFISLYAIINKFIKDNKENIKLSETLIALNIGLIILFISNNLIKDYFFRVLSSQLDFIFIGLITFSIISLIFHYNFKIPRKISIKLFNTRYVRIVLKALVISILFTFISFFFIWFFYHSGEIYTPREKMPLYFYPNLIGIIGILSLIGIYIIIKEKSLKKRNFVIFLALFFFLFGNLIGIINTYLGLELNYSEGRFIIYLKIPLAILSPLPLNSIYEKLKGKSNTLSLKSLKLKIISVSFIGLIFLLGFSTTALNLEYWYYSKYSYPSNNNPTREEHDALEFLKNKLNNDPYSFLVTASSSSYNKLLLAGPPDRTYRLFYQTSTLEMGLTQLYRHPKYTHPYIFLNEKDRENLINMDCFFNEYSKLTPLIFNNSDVTIYDFPKSSYPKEKSNVSLTFPYYNFLSTYQSNFAYKLLADNYIDFTTKYDLDSNIFNSKNIFLTYDPFTKKETDSIYEFSDNFEYNDLNNWKLISGDWKNSNHHVIINSNDFGKILSLTPILREFNVTFETKLIKENNMRFKYIGLIFSYSNENNFDTVEFNFMDNGYLYLLIREIREEGRKGWAYSNCIPKWPGINTGIHWNFNEKYRFNIIYENNILTVKINNTKYLEKEFFINEGKLGILSYNYKYGWLDNFLIKGYYSHYYTRIRNLLDKYVREKEGKLYILNLNGYHHFAEQLFSLNNSQFISASINYKNSKLSLAPNINVNKTKILNGEVKILANYSNNKPEAGYIFKKKYGTGELLYINIKPLLKEKFLKDNLLITKELLNPLNLEKMKDQEVLNEYSGYVKGISFGNKTILNTSSIIIDNPSSLSIKIHNDGDVKYFENLTNLEFKGNFFELKISNPLISRKNGFYTFFKQNYSKCIPHNGYTIVVNTTNHNSTIISIDYLEIYSKNDNPFEICLRTPIITSNEIIFENVLEFHKENKIINGENIALNNNCTFKIDISDNYIGIKNFSIDEQNKVFISKENLQSVITHYSNMVFYYLLFFIFFIIFLSYELYQRKYKSEFY